MRHTHRSGALVACSLLLAATALARPFDPPVAADVRTRTPAPFGPDAPDAHAAGGTTERWSQLDTAALRRRIGEWASQVSPQTRANALRRFDAAAQRVDLVAQDAGDAMLAGRLAREFRVPGAALSRDRTGLGATWGELLVALTLAANARAHVDAAQLVRWRHGGMDWSELAAGLGLSLASAVSSVDAEARVAAGLTPADGRVAAIYGAGARGQDPGLDTGPGTRRGGRGGAERRPGAGH